MKNWFEEELERSPAQHFDEEIQPPPEQRQKHQAAGTGASEYKNHQTDKHETLDIALSVAANDPELPDWDPQPIRDTAPKPTAEEDPDRAGTTRPTSTELDSETQIKQKQQPHGDSELWKLSVQSLTGHKWTISLVTCVCWSVILEKQVFMASCSMRFAVLISMALSSSGSG